MLTEYIHQHARELHELEQSRPRYDRVTDHRHSRLRAALRRVALPPASASVAAGGGLADVLIRPAGGADSRALARLAESSERRVPSGLILVAEVDAHVVAAVPLDERSFVLTDLLRPTRDVVQLLELRSQQVRASGLEKVA